MAENEAIFRDANEQIQRRARELDFREPVPFLCEWGRPQCRELLRLTLDEYEAVRGNSRYSFVKPGHEGAAGMASRIVARDDLYVLLEKAGGAADVAAERDPRQA